MVEMILSERYFLFIYFKFYVSHMTIIINKIKKCGVYCSFEIERYKDYNQ